MISIILFINIFTFACAHLTGSLCTEIENTQFNAEAYEARLPLRRYANVFCNIQLSALWKNYAIMSVIVYMIHIYHLQIIIIKETARRHFLNCNDTRGRKHFRIFKIRSHTNILPNYERRKLNIFTTKYTQRITIYIYKNALSVSVCCSV